MNKADVLVAVGARFDDRVTGKLSAFAPGATVVHLDVDSAEIGKLRHADIPVVGPLKQVLAELAREVARQRETGAPAPETWLRQLADWRDEFPLRYGAGGEMMKPQKVLETLEALTAGRDDVVFTTGVGQHQMWAMQYLLCDTPRSFISSGGLGTMGFGIPAAIGAKAARPDATVVCVDEGRLLPDDLPGARHAVSKPADRRRPREQRLPRHGAVAGHVLRGAFSHIAPHAPGARLRAARRGHGAAGFRSTWRRRPSRVLAEALSLGARRSSTAASTARALLDPMIPSGAAALDLVEWPGEESEVIT